VVDHAVLADGPPPLVTAIVALEFADGERALYHLTVLIDDDGSLTDATEDADRLAVLGPLMAHGRTLTGSRGSFRFAGAGLDPLSPPGGESVRSIGSEQSNSSVVLDDEIIVKLFRRVEPGDNPEIELTRLLTSEGFPSIAAHVGEVRYETEGDSDIDLAIAQNYIKDGRDGWARALAGARTVYDQASRIADPDELRTTIEGLSLELLEELERLGDTTAELHVLLARVELEPEISPEPIDAGDLKLWAERARESLDRVRRLFPDALEGLEAGTEKVIDSVHSVDEAGAKTRVHGDYHLGQVMLTPRGWVILDFEGEPARALEERRTKESPLRDVAGMLRSFSYAATATAFERADPGSEEWGLIEEWARTWEDLARERFLRAYLRTSHEGGFLPPEDRSVAVMLNFYEIEKAIYELGYERGHRPEWVPIPLRGIRQSIQKGAEW
jgi:maltose alpha-D-glucosyltransferase / alpha-amylase